MWKPHGRAGRPFLLHLISLQLSYDDPSPLGTRRRRETIMDDSDAFEGGDGLYQVRSIIMNIFTRTHSSSRMISLQSLNFPEPDLQADGPFLCCVMTYVLS